MAVSFSRWGNDLYTGKRNYDIVGKRWWWFIISIIISVIGIFLMFVPGIKLGIEFVGGSEFRVTNVADSGDLDPARTAVEQTIGGADVPTVSSVGSSTVRVETVSLTTEQTNELSQALADAYGVDRGNDVSADTIGPTWGADVAGKSFRGALIFLVLVTVAMTLYFRAWEMALSAIVALLHDLIITVGVYAAVGWEVTPATLIGFLTVLGYSIYDTVVVFDKVRENTANVTDQTQFTYSEAANLAVNQTLVRSINTSVVALLPVASILFIGSFLLGAGTLRDISLALFVGMAIGTFSSIFVATPLEVALRISQSKLRDHTNKVLSRRAAAGVASDQVTALTPIGAIKAGSHQGQAAQPRRKR